MNKTEVKQRLRGLALCARANPALRENAQFRAIIAGYRLALIEANRSLGSPR